MFNAKLDYYKVFAMVAQEGSITAASEKLFISQPAVSQSIKLLEQDLSCRLFLRSAKGVSLTPEGEKLFFHVSKGLNEIELGEKKLREMLNLDSGEIRIGASDMTLRFYLLPFLETFHKLYPNIKIIVSNAPTPETIESLSADKIDFGIVSTPFDNIDDFSVISVAPLADTFVAGKVFEDRLKDRIVSVEELEQLPIICLEKNTSTRKSIDSFLALNNVTINPEFELATSDLIVKFAEKNMGIGLVVRDFAVESINSGNLFEINLSETLPQRSICVITKRSSASSHASKKLLEMMI